MSFRSRYWIAWTLVGAALLAGFVAQSFFLGDRHDEPAPTAAAPTQLRAASSLAGLSSPTSGAPAVKNAAAEAADNQRKAPSVDEQFEQATDYYKFAQSLATRAAAGEPRARFYLGLAMQDCLGTVGLYSKPSSDPYQNVDSFFASMPNAPRSAYEIARASIDRCAGFFRGNPLAGLVASDLESLKPNEWIRQAANAGDPVAAAYVARDLASLLAGTLEPKQAEAARVELRKLSEVAARSGDPRALARLGGVMADVAVTPDVRVGLAFSVAACRLGLDCSPKRIASCVANGTCSAGNPEADFIATLEKDLPRGDFDKVTRMADEIVDAIRTNNGPKLDKYLQLRDG